METDRLAPIHPVSLAKDSSQLARPCIAFAILQACVVLKWNSRRCHNLRSSPATSPYSTNHTSSASMPGRSASLTVP